MKRLVLLSTFLTIFGCTTAGRANMDISAIPKKCGNYDIVYGKVLPDGYFMRDDNKKVILFGKFDSEQLVGRRVILSGKYWHQAVGGLLRDDGTGSKPYVIINLDKVELIQVIESGTSVDSTVFKNRCSDLKRR